MKVNDITGSVFARLSVLRRSVNNSQGRSSWLCRCDCGKEITVLGTHLISGNTKSCGCLKRGPMADCRYTAEYIAWRDAIQRCYNPKIKRYKDYGGRGIRMCNEWRDDFRSFLSHIGKKPVKSLTLDRIDTNGDYEPGNVRWATKATQSRNRRCNKLDIDKARAIRERYANGESYGCIADAYGVSLGTIYEVVQHKTWSEAK
jgi:hypothetical protein